METGKRERIAIRGTLTIIMDGKVYAMRETRLSTRAQMADLARCNQDRGAQLWETDAKSSHRLV